MSAPMVSGEMIHISDCIVCERDRLRRDVRSLLDMIKLAMNGEESLDADHNEGICRAIERGLPRTTDSASVSQP